MAAQSTVYIAFSAFVNGLDAKTLDAAGKVFELADNASARFADQLATLGLADRKSAKPYAMAWAAKKYSAKIEDGQRGAKLPRDSAAEKAMHRVLNAVFPSEASVFAGKDSAANQADNLAKALKAFDKLTAAEVRKFLKERGLAKA